MQPEHIQDWNAWHEAGKAGYSLLVSSLVLLAGWFVGARLTYGWNVKQKRRELQLSSSQQFYSAYGEFFVVWKLWDRLDHTNPQFEEHKWELHKRAAAAEAIIEGTLVKVCSELNLKDQQTTNLGRFRQAFQQLRQSIRDDKPLPWPSSECAEYKAFKSLAVSFAILLGREWPSHTPSPQDASKQLMNVTSNEWEHTWVRG